MEILFIKWDKNVSFDILYGQMKNKILKKIIGKPVFSLYATFDNQWYVMTVLDFEGNNLKSIIWSPHNK